MYGKLVSPVSLDWWVYQAKVFRLAEELLQSKVHHPDLYYQMVYFDKVDRCSVLQTGRVTFGQWLFSNRSSNMQLF